MKRVCIALILTAVMVTTMALLPVAAFSIDYGDVNDDGRINNRDLGILQQHLNEYDAVINTAAADVNDDGRVNNRDLGLLQQYLNEWDVQLGPKVPLAQLPAGGYDPDGRGRIFIQSVVQEGDTVYVTFENVTSRWMSEETSYIEYICTDAEGNVLTLEDRYYGMLYFGMLEAGEIDVMSFTLPEGTAKVEFGECRIIYWTQWS